LTPPGFWHTLFAVPTPKKKNAAPHPGPGLCSKTQRWLFALIVLLVCGTCAGKDACFDCHRVMEGMSLKFTNDVHFASTISCANCHGGDQNETNMNIAMSSSRGFKVRVTRQGVPEFCGKCHGDTNFMSKYDPQPRVDQLAQYKTSVHGKALAAGRKRAAECVDCHSVHNTRAVSDPLSTAGPQRVSQTCAKCHVATGEAFAGSQHGRRFKTARTPGCTVCHSAHATEPATIAMLTGQTSVCTRCHRAGSPQLQLAEDMAQVLARLEAAGPGSKDALDRARVAVHSLNLEAVKKAAEPIPPTSDAK
jgi:predicted CXXCH cytochrome family protein